MMATERDTCTASHRTGFAALVPDWLWPILIAGLIAVGTTQATVGSVTDRVGTLEQAGKAQGETVARIDERLKAIQEDVAEIKNRLGHR